LVASQRGVYNIVLHAINEFVANIVCAGKMPVNDGQQQIIILIGRMEDEAEESRREKAIMIMIMILGW
jgi:hypothetical protein